VKLDVHGLVAITVNFLHVLRPGPIFKNKDLPSVLILKIAYKSLNDSLYCSYIYHWCLCTCMGKCYMLLLTFLINLS